MSGPKPPLLPRDWRAWVAIIACIALAYGVIYASAGLATLLD